MLAEAEKEAINMYGMDLLWMLVRTKYDGDLTQPSTLTHIKRKERKQTKEEIIQSILQKLS